MTIEYTTEFPDGTEIVTRDDTALWFATCKGCGKRWQLLDWNCSLHQLQCNTRPYPTATDCAPDGA